MRSLVEADIPALSIAKTTGLQNALDAKQDDLTFTDDYVAETSVIATKTYVDNAAANAVKINNGDAAVEGQFVTAAVQTNGEVAVSRRALKSTDFAADVVPESAVNGLTEALAAKQDNLTFASTPSADNKVATMTEVNAVSNQIASLDMTKVECGNGEVLTSAVQEDGLVTITKRALVAADFKDDLIPESAVNGLTEALASKQDNIAWADGYAYNETSNKAATVDYVSSVIQGLNGAMHFIGVVNGDTFDAAVADLTPAAGDVVLYGYDEYVYDAANRVWVKLGNESIYQTKEQATTDHKALSDAIALKQDILGFEGTYNKETNKVVTVNAMNSAIAAAIDIDTADTAVAGQLVSAVSQADGKITVTRRALVAGDFANDVVPEAAVNGLTEALASKQNNLSFMTEPSATNKVATKTEIDAINNAIGDMAEDTTASNGQIISAVKQEGGVVTATVRDLVTADFKDNLINQSAIIDLATTLAGKETAGAAAQALNDAKSYADKAVGDAVANLDYTDTPVNGQFVTGINMTDGELTVSRSTIDVKHLTQTTGEYLVFDCGTASTNI